MKKVIVIVGPTGSGKTKRSINLAKKINAEIINGDSVQIYQELNIGSAKITESEKAGIKHHLFDIRNVGMPYTAYDFQKDVRDLIDKIDFPMIVGGTGFYIKSSLYDYEFNRESLNNDFLEFNNEELYERLIKLDPLIKIDKNNRVRLVRALNQAESGKLRSLKQDKDKPLYNILTIYLDYPREELKELLVKRLDQMFERGFLEEVKTLKDNNHHLNIIGYRELSEHLDGLYTLDEAKEKIIKASMRLAKKQKTWFKNQMDSFIVDARLENIDEVLYEKVLEFLGE